MNVNTGTSFACFKPVASLLIAATLIYSSSAQAGNDNCLTCHAAMKYGEPTGDKPRIHDPSGKFIHEPHGMLACTDCHTDITDVPHREGIERKIKCEACHN